MSLVLPNEGLVDQLTYLLKSTISGVADWLLVLWTNSSYTPSQSSVYSDLTLATFTGYSAVTVTRGTWTTPTIISNAAVSTWGTVATQWTNTGSSQTIYGYALVTASSPVIRVVEKFASPVTVATGGIIGVLPRYTFTTAP